MEKIMGHKKIIAVVAAVAVVILGVFLYMMTSGNKNTSYRSIKIVEMEGTVTIDRDGIDGLNASINMNLVSGDSVTTSQNSYVVLKLDTDKYVMLGENGAMTVTAEGSETSGRTSIQLASGSVLNEIQNPLGQNSTFDIVTPNATMSVRGTVFEVRKNADGTIGVLVYDGKVAVGLDGKEPAMYQAGEYTEFTGGNAPEFLTEKGTITEAQMSEEVLERLQKIQEQGRNLNLDVIQKPSDASDLQASAKDETAQQKEQELAQQKEQELAQQKEQELAQQKEQELAQQKEQELAQKQKEESEQKKEPAQKKESEQKQTQKQEVVQKPAPEQIATPVEEPDIDVDDDDDDDEDSNTDVGMNPVPNPEEPSKPEPDKPKPEGPDKPHPEQPDKPHPEQPDKPKPEQPDKPKPEQSKVTYLLPCIVLSTVGEDGKVYSELKDVDPIVYMEKQADEAIWQNVTVDQTAGYKGDIGGATHYNVIGWCTEDGTTWTFDKETVQDDVTIYPVWGNNGKSYYPVVYEDPDTGKTYCNSIEMGSIPTVNGTVIGQ